VTGQFQSLVLFQVIFSDRSRSIRDGDTLVMGSGMEMCASQRHTPRTSSGCVGLNIGYSNCTAAEVSHGSGDRVARGTSR
jgi:hypothetical protein